MNYYLWKKWNVNSSLWIIIAKRENDYIELAIKLSKKYGNTFIYSFINNQFRSVPDYQRNEYENKAKIIREIYYNIYKQNAIKIINLWWSGEPK